MNAYLLRRFGASVADSYSTNFPATENPISEGSRWRVGGVTGYYGSPRTTPGKAFAATTVTPGELDDNLVQLISPVISPNCRVTTTVSKSTGSKTDSFEAAHYGRMNIDAGTTNVRGYEILIGFNPSEFQVVKWLGVSHAFPGNFTVLSTSGVPAGVNDGDVFRTDFIGNVITCYRNGVLFNTTTDNSSPWLDGSPGFGFFVSPGNTPSDYCWSSWSVNGI